MTSALNDIQTVADDAARLSERLRLLRTRGLAITLMSGVGWTSAAGCLLFLVFTAALGWWGGMVLRLAGWSVLVLGTLAVCITKLAIPLTALKRNDAIARRVGLVCPEGASDLLSASQLTRDPQIGVFDPFLLSSLFRNAEKTLIALTPAGRIFPKHQLLAPAVALALAAAVTLSTYTALPYVVETGLASLIREQSPPERHDNRIQAKAPVVGDLSISLRYPAYLKRAERRLPGISGGIVAPLGTTVILQGHSLVAGAVTGEIHLPDGARSPLTVGTDNTVHGSFVVGQSGTFSLALGNANLMMAGPEQTIEMEVDAPPVIRLLRPSARVELAMDGALDIEFEAEDDHGLTHLDLLLRAGPNLELRKTIARYGDDVKQVKMKYRWLPESVRISDETELQLELEAYDNDTMLGPKPGRSVPLDIRFLTPLSRHKNALEEQSLALDALVDLLAHRIEYEVPTNKHTAESGKRFTTLRGETEDFLANTAKLIGALNEDVLSPKRVVDIFQQIREDLSNQLIFESRLYEETILGDYRSRSGVDRVTKRILENAVVRIDDLIIEQQLSKVVHTGSDLESERSELDKLLSRYRTTRAESIRRAVLDAIEEMEEEVQRLQKSMEKIRGKVSDTYMNSSSVVRMDLIGSLSKLRALLAEENVAGALALVKQLEIDLARLMAGLEGGLISFRTDRFGEGERFVGDLLERVMALESGQLQLRRETLALKRRYEERLNAVMKEKIDGLVTAAKGRVEGMRRAEGQLSDVMVKEGGQENRSRLLAAIEELELALRQGDLNEAREVAEAVIAIVNTWQTMEGNRAPRALDAIAKEAKRFTEEIARAYPRPAQLFNDKDLREARSRATQQRLLAAKSRKLDTWIKRQGEEARFLSNRAEDALAKVGRRMSRSVQALEEQQINEAMDEQSAALDELARLREDLKRGDEMTTFETRPMVVNGQVNLPDPEEFEVPPEFREDILEAMRGDLPNQYEEAIRKYYETLVK